MVSSRTGTPSAIAHYNYTLYSNGTLSNGTNCWLSFNEYKPQVLLNGTVLNGTSCYSPINGIGRRGGIGIAFGALFATTIVFTLMNLRKHGKRYLPHEKRWKVIGRRWQWYWMLFIAVCGTISAVTGIDVDRDYLQSTAIILQSFFYHLMFPALLACVWEGVRHWGSWQERQICDSDPFSLPQDDLRTRKEFYMPLLFYLFAFLNFFMTIPRPWTPVQDQRSPTQTDTIAAPAATDARFKAGAFLAAIAYLTIIYNLHHSIHYYRPRRHGINVVRFIHYAPSKFLLIFTLLGVRIAYGIASSFSFTISPLRATVSPGYIYGLGYGPTVMILIVNNVYGFLEPNEDTALLTQRRARERLVDSELGIAAHQRKPSWWRQGGRDSRGMTAEARLKALTSEMGPAADGGRDQEREIEMVNSPRSHGQVVKSMLDV